MSGRQRQAWAAGGLLALLSAVITAWDSTMKWLTIRENRASFELAVQKCEEGGGRWWRGECDFTQREEAP